METETMAEEMSQAERERTAEFDPAPVGEGDEFKPVGRSIEEMTADGVEDEEGQQLLDFGDHVNLSLKGRKPTRSQVKIRPISRDVRGQLGDKGDDETYTFLIIGRIHKIELPFERDASGSVIGKTRRHILDPVDIQRVPDDVAAELRERLEERR